MCQVSRINAYFTSFSSITYKRTELKKHSSMNQGSIQHFQKTDPEETTTCFQIMQEKIKKKFLHLKIYSLDQTDPLSYLEGSSLSNLEKSRKIQNDTACVHCMIITLGSRVDGIQVTTRIFNLVMYHRCIHIKSVVVVRCCTINSMFLSYHPSKVLCFPNIMNIDFNTNVLKELIAKIAKQQYARIIQSFLIIEHNQ